MSNNITIELCAEDRARLDRLAEALERRACDKCVAAALGMIGTTKQPVEADPLQQKLAETLAKANAPTEKPTEAAGEAKATPAPIDHPADDTLPWETAAPAEEAKPTITQEQLQQKVTQLAAANNGALKVKVREIVTAYAKKVSDVPEDKRAEVWDKLTDLEKEGRA